MIDIEPQLRDALCKRCDALVTYVANHRLAYDPAALQHVLGECDALDRDIERGHAKTKVREVRIWAKQGYGPGAHGLSQEPARTSLLQSIDGVRKALVSGL